MGYVKSEFVQHINEVKLDKQPVWSVMIPTYNSNDYLAFTIESILVQDPGPDYMQIQVVDDASPKHDTLSLVKKIAGDRVECFIQPKNLGLVGNFTDCIQRSRGNFVHILHGDDLVEMGFYKKNEEIFFKNESIGAIANRTKYINGDGSFRTVGPSLQEDSGLAPNFTQRYLTGFGLNTPAVTVRRSVYEQLGGFDSRIANLGEDREMWSRIARWYSFGYQTEALAVYRIHDAALTKKIKLDGSIIRDTIKSNEIVASHFKETEFESLIHQKRQRISRNGQISAASALKKSNFEAFKIYFKESFRYYPTLKQFYWLIRALIDPSYK